MPLAATARGAIREAARLDGTWVLVTNDDTLWPADAADACKSLLVIALLAAPRHRQTQLCLLERMSRLLMKTDPPHWLRAARTAEGVRNAIREAAEEVGEVTEERPRTVGIEKEPTTGA